MMTEPPFAHPVVAVPMHHDGVVVEAPQMPHEPLHLINAVPMRSDSFTGFGYSTR